jgi:pyrroline-5-carboxylate reductase
VRIAVLGAGMLGEALLSGLLASGVPPTDLVVSERRAEHAVALASRYGVEVTGNAAAAATADVVFLAVKPQDMPALLTELGPVVTADQLVVSMAAGVTLATLEGALAAQVPVVRVMSNTPVRIRLAMHCRPARTPPRPTSPAPRVCSPPSARRSGCPSRSRTRSPPCPAADRPTSSSSSRR